MKTTSKNKKKFYVHQIVRKDQKSNNTNRLDITNINRDKSSNLAENIGYHLDPKRYDSLRGNMHTEQTAEELTKDIKAARKPHIAQFKRVDEENENPVAEKLANEFYDIDNGETVLDEVISLEEMEHAASFYPVEEENENHHQKEEIEQIEYEEISLDDNLNNNEENIESIIPQNEAVLDNEENEIKEYDEIKNEEIVQDSNTTKEEKEDVVSELSNVMKASLPKKEVVNQPVKTKVYRNYIAPSLDLLKFSESNNENDVKLAEEQKKVIDEILANYSIKAHVDRYIFGPTVIEYLIKFDSLMEDVTSIKKCEKNLQMYLSTNNVRMLTPIPNMPYAGIEIPRPKDNRSTVYLGDLLADKAFVNSKYNLPVAVGIDNFSNKIYIDLSDMPHGLAAGASKSGKSVTLNTFIISLIYHFTPNDVRLILIDPKIVEFSKYQDIPHLAVPVITNQDLFEPIMEWLCNEMERRYQILNKYGCVSLDELNEVLIERKEPKLPYLVLIFDEFNDWFAGASNQVEIYTTRLMQKARAAGINIILATQRPSADVIKGAIKANLTTRFAFRVASFADSQVILGQAGAEKLEGRGDMILRTSGMDDLRLQAAFVSNSEVKKVVDFLRENNEVDYILTEEELLQSSTSRGAGNGSSDPHTGVNDEIFEEVALYVVRNQNASANQLTKIFGTGFNRMDAIFKELESLGIVSKTQQGTKRKVLVSESELDSILNNL